VAVLELAFTRVAVRMGAPVHPLRWVVIDALVQWKGASRDYEGDAATSRQLAGNSYIGYDRLGHNVLCSYRGASCCGPKT
jgi:hypothetical protein